jgi:hypothetical protein
MPAADLPSKQFESEAPTASPVGGFTPRRRGPTGGQVLVVTSVMFTFISFWRTAAIVLCDLASTAYYIGGIVESQIGAAAPWFILAVMVFSFAVRSVYIESCALFVRGGVYRIVKEAIGAKPARLITFSPARSAASPLVSTSLVSLTMYLNWVRAVYWSPIRTACRRASQY